MNNDTTTDVSRDEAHEEITWDLIQMVEHNDEICSLLEESIVKNEYTWRDQNNDHIFEIDVYSSDGIWQIIEYKYVNFSY